MWEGSLAGLLKQVVTSWQVIACAAGFVLYVSLVQAAAKPPGPRRAKPGGPPKIRRPKPGKPALDPNTDTDDLGLGD